MNIKELDFLALDALLDKVIYYDHEDFLHFVSDNISELGRIFYRYKGMNNIENLEKFFYTIGHFKNDKGVFLFNDLITKFPMDEFYRERATKEKIT